MNKIATLFLSIFLFVASVIYAQTISENNLSSKKDRLIHLETGVNLSLPVHIMMYRSHRLGIGINLRTWKAISSKYELGIKADYDYRFIKKNSRILTPESTLEERALHNNFSVFSIKPNLQYNYLSTNRSYKNGIQLYWLVQGSLLH